MIKNSFLLEKIYPHSLHLFLAKSGQKISDIIPPDLSPGGLPDYLKTISEQLNLPGYIADVAAIEYRLHQAVHSDSEFRGDANEVCLNPTLSLLRVDWQGLPRFFAGNEAVNNEPERGEEYVLVWRNPKSGKPVVRTAKPEELLALKIVVEGLDQKTIARRENISPAHLDTIIDRTAAEGILLKPASTLTRGEPHCSGITDPNEKFLTAQVFTLQCHITQACDLNCRHCYDRTSRRSLSLSDAIKIFDQLYDFCRSGNVYGQVSFSGGNPLLHPDFFEMYHEAVQRGFMTAILGNPTTPEILAKINAIRKPEFYQVSLEGLRDHNDYIRGKGFFDRVMRFLDNLREAGIYSMVMLTLTRDNLDQVLPLADYLRDRVDLFTFNRLSMVGEGTRLVTPQKEELESFLASYLEARKNNPIMGLKDNLFNIIRHRQGEELFGGCAGHGCGAAFNFVALLPDGEVHACRKFNSPVGNIHRQSLADIYTSEKAELYRRGPAACNECPIRAVCGGCLAVIDSRGLDITSDRDPCCFITRP